MLFAKWHFWSLTNNDFPTNQTFHNFMTLIPSLDLHRLWVVSIEHLQRVWHASRERLPFRTPGSRPPFWDLLMLQLLRPNSSNLHVFTRLFTSNTPGTFSILPFITFYAAIPTPKTGNFSKVVTFGKSILYPPVHKTPFLKLIKYMLCMF